jgi:hypothetical protein
MLVTNNSAPSYTQTRKGAAVPGFVDPAGAGASSTNQVGSIRAADQPINRGRAGQVRAGRLHRL